MYEKFRAVYGKRRDHGSGSSTPWLTDGLLTSDGYADFAREFCGTSFGGGIYRVHDSGSGPRALANIREAFPEHDGHLFPFGYDWLGRQFAINSKQIRNGQPLVMLLEPETGESLEIPATLDRFHAEELIDFSDAALAAEFFTSWANDNPESIPLDRTSCVGYRVPLFLGGQDIIENLELIDLDVYWSICGQPRQGTLHLPNGTTINDVPKR